MKGWIDRERESERDSTCVCVADGQCSRVFHDLLFQRY